MSRREYPEVDPVDICARVDHLQALLTAYQGEPIEKGQHLIHDAVVELEKRLILRPGHRQPHVLPSGISDRWFAMLRLSREGEAYTARLYACYLASLLEGLREAVISGRWQASTKRDDPPWPMEFRDHFPWLDREEEEREEVDP